jgi:hypothetical protein
MNAVEEHSILSEVGGADNPHITARIGRDESFLFQQCGRDIPFLLSKRTQEQIES